MEKAKLQTNVKCNVKACKYNVGGALCERDGIDITTAEDMPTAHYCGSYQKECDD